MIKLPKPYILSAILCFDPCLAFWIPVCSLDFAYDITYHVYDPGLFTCLWAWITYAIVLCPMWLYYLVLDIFHGIMFWIICSTVFYPTLYFTQAYASAFGVHPWQPPVREHTA